MLAIVCQTILSTMTLFCTEPMNEYHAEGVAMNMQGYPGMSEPELIRERDPRWDTALERYLNGYDVWPPRQNDSSDIEEPHDYRAENK